MSKYRKKPVVIDAFQLGGGEVWPDWFSEAINTKQVRMFNRAATRDAAEIHTMEGTMIAEPDDWIIRGIKGELYPCKSDVFAATYEAVENAVGPVERMINDGSIGTGTFESNR